LRPQVNIKDIVFCSEILADFFSKIQAEEDMIEEAEILIKYEGYISKEQELADKFYKFENIALREDINYSEFKSLSSEAREKLNRIKPKTIGQASRISGVSPADVSVLIVYLGR
jgi:tRNA uridine 5-carboxymethylaminomethyl modification enzyme